MSIYKLKTMRRITLSKKMILWQKNKKFIWIKNLKNNNSNNK